MHLAESGTPVLGDPLYGRASKDALVREVGIALGTYTAGLDSLVEYLGGLTDHGPTGVPAILFSNTVSNAPAITSPFAAVAPTR